MTYQTRVYIRGLFSAGISAGSNAVIFILADPNTYNLFNGGAKKLAIVTLLNALLGFATYTKEHPLPNPDADNNYQSVVNQKIAELKGTGDGK